MLDSLVRVSRRVGPLQLQPRSWHARHPEVQGAAKPRPKARWAAAESEEMARLLAGLEPIVLPGSSHEARSGAPERYACFQRFHVLFHFLFKVLFIFPSRYLFAIGLSQIFSFGRTLPPGWRCSPKQHDSREGSLVGAFRRYGAITLSGSLSQ